MVGREHFRLPASTTRLERAAAIVVVASFAILGAVLLRPGVVVYDGSHYFAYVRSAFIDRDLEFSNEIVPVEAQVKSPLGRTANSFPVGAAVLWAPFFGAAHAMCIAGGARIAPFCRDGFG